MDFDKYRNVSIEGETYYAGYMTKPKVNRLDVRPALGLRTYFGLLTHFGDLKSHLDKSTEKYDKTILRKAGEDYEASFKILNSTNAVQLLCQPFGYNATFTFVNHADRQTIPRLNAIMYGASSSNHDAYGVKGLISRGLKGTWSVFAKSSETGDSRNEGLDNPDYMEACLRLRDEGIEIIPHTISYEPDYRVDFIDYLSLFEEFNPRNWTDHFLRTTNPSSGLHSQGNNPNSTNYVMDLLESYDYVWSYQDSYAYGTPAEKINQYGDDIFGFPNHLVYQHDRIKRPINGKIWQYKNTWTGLRYLILNDVNPNVFIQELVDKCGVFTDHTYFAMRSRENVHWCFDNNDVVISDKLDAYFEEIHNRVLNGEIWNPTMTEWLDYFIQLSNIKIIHENQKIIVINSNNNPVIGCSFKINNYYGTPTLNGDKMNSKIVSGGIIVWMDLPEGSNIIKLI